jgi:hypothetical protein
LETDLCDFLPLFTFSNSVVLSSGKPIHQLSDPADPESKLDAPAASQTSLRCPGTRAIGDLGKFSAKKFAIFWKTNLMIMFSTQKYEL